jgi:hypothetical protein
MRLRHLFGIIYVIVGVVIAWLHTYITLALLKVAASALLAIFLWWLVLLGVNLHVH